MSGSKLDDPVSISRPTFPGALGDEPSQPISIGVKCPSCEKSNRVGIRSCVYCGAPLAGIEPEATSGPPRDTTVDEAPPASGRHRSGFLSDAPRNSSAPSFDTMEGQLADPLIGVVVAERYRIVEMLGRGGMGIVYKVEHTRIGKLLAMKLLTGELSQSAEVVRRFKQEALLSSKLSSPNTVQVFDFGVSDRLTYLVMELVTGEDLARVLRNQGPMPFARLGPVVIQMCNSLAEAHQKGIVHRDIKPENVMLVRPREGTDLVKVLDFGLAKLRESSDLSELTSQGAIVGTPYFMAPEQVRGEAVDGRTDIYAVGALMYRALTGHYPLTGPSPMAVFTKHLTELPVPPHERAPDLAIPPAVSAIVMRALQKEPEGRFERVEELQAAIVEELRASGVVSVESLLDSAALRKLARIARDARAVEGATPQKGTAVATRDEVEAYERKLRRQRYTAVALFLVLLVGAAGVGARLLLTRTEPFNGLEVEPNDSAADATRVPFGRTVSGHLGQRIDPTHGDRDFYAFDVPAPAGGGDAVVQLHVGALPNFAMCTLFYPQGYAQPLAQYCVGRPGRDLSIPALRLAPGRYLAAVMQDLDPYGGTVAPFIHENVSDAYLFDLKPADPAPDVEIEPNDQVASANTRAPGGTQRGVIGWGSDEDVVCVPVDVTAPIAWRVRDGLRPAGAVLEATPLRGREEGAAVRVHANGQGTPGATDVRSPWESTALPPDPDAPRCLRLRLTHDPWTSSDQKGSLAGGSEEYVVEIVAK